MYVGLCVQAWCVCAHVGVCVVCKCVFKHACENGLVCKSKKVGESVTLQCFEASHTILIF